jgi:hypothetical protein
MFYLTEDGLRDKEELPLQIEPCVAHKITRDFFHAPS